MSGGDLIRRLPAVRGQLVENAPLAPMTWFRVGGLAEVLFRPQDEQDLADFLGVLPAEIPVAVIGVGSNLLVRDGGIAGVTIRLGRGFVYAEPDGDEIRVGAGTLDRSVALAAARAGIAGLEFLSGIPGTIGGGFQTNAGAYGSEFKDVLISADAIDRSGKIHRVIAGELGFSYRHSSAPPDWVFTRSIFRGRPGDPTAIAQRMAEIHASREASQPIRERTGGSTFANPPGHQVWQLIHAAGCRGLRHGGAMVSQKHANFLINTGNASAADIEVLGEEIRRRVHDKFDILLEWEIRRIGRPSAEAATAAAAFADAE